MRRSFSITLPRAKACHGVHSPAGRPNGDRLCALNDFTAARLVIALKEAEHRPLIELRFPEVAGNVTYWNVDDVEFAPPSIALALIDSHVRELIAKLD